MHLLFYFFMYCRLWCCYLHKIFFSCISTSSFSSVQRFFSKMKLLKTMFYTQLKQTNLKNQIKISWRRFKKKVDNVFQHFVSELKHYNPDMRMDLQLVPVFLYLYPVYVVLMLPFRMIFFIKCYALFFC